MIETFSIPELHDVNIRLIGPYRIKLFAFYFIKYKSDEMLNLLIDLYGKIPIVKTKDYDGVVAKEIDLEDEEIIVNAICEYTSELIIPILKESVLQGRIGKVKEKVINKLLDYISKQEVLDYLSEYFPAKSFMITALTDKTKNAEFAINYINEL